MTTINKDGQLDIDLGDKPTIGYRLEQLETLIEQLQFRIATLEAIAEGPMIPNINPAYENKCLMCDIDFTGLMGYVCSNVDCPMYPKIGDNFAPGSTIG